MSLAKTLLLLCLIVLSTPARSADVFTFEPVQGSWYPIGAPGLYLGVDIGPTGFAFITLHDFDDAGNERTRFLQGALEVNDAPTWRATGVFARLRSEVYAQSLGSCIGCAFRPPGVIDLGAAAEIRFTNGQNGELDIDGRRVAITRYPMYNGVSGLPQNQLLGKWLMLARTAGGDRVEQVEIVPYNAAGDIVPTLIPPADVGAPTPDPEQWRSLVCVSCATAESRAIFNFGADLLVAYAGGDIVLNYRYGLGIRAAAPAYRLHDNEGVIQGRAISPDPGTTDYGSRLIREFTLVRLPDGWRR